MACSLRVCLTGVILTLGAGSLLACGTTPNDQAEMPTASPSASPAAETAAAPQPETPASPLPKIQSEACELVDNGYGPTGTVNIRVETVTSGLEVPWGLGFLPNGDLLVTERPGRLRLIQNGELRPRPLSHLPPPKAVYSILLYTRNLRPIAMFIFTTQRKQTGRR
jgi:glucose/arabinose dehydrogenase